MDRAGACVRVYVCVCASVCVRVRVCALLVRVLRCYSCTSSSISQVLLKVLSTAFPTVRVWPQYLTSHFVETMHSLVSQSRAFKQCVSHSCFVHRLADVFVRV